MVVGIRDVGFESRRRKTIGSTRLMALLSVPKGIYFNFKDPKSMLFTVKIILWMTLKYHAKCALIQISFAKPKHFICFNSKMIYFYLLCPNIVSGYHQATFSEIENERGSVIQHTNNK